MSKIGRWRAAAMSLFLICCLGACASYSSKPLAGPVRTTALVPASAHFVYQAQAPDIARQPDPGWRNRHYKMEHLEWPSIGANGQPGDQVRALYYRAHSKRTARDENAPRPLVIVLPLWGTSTYPPDVIASTIRKRSDGAMHIIQLQGENYLFDWDAMAQAPSPDAFHDTTHIMGQRMHNTVIDVRRLIDWAQLQSEIDGQRIALVGFSMSSVAGGLILGSEPRLRAAVMLMGGAHPGDIAARCNGPLENVRTQITTRFGWENAQFAQAVGNAWAGLDPADYPSQVNPARVLMIDSRYDECMPPHSREDYWQALGYPLRITLRLGHRQSFYSLTPFGLSIMRGKIYRFLAGALQ